MTTDGTLFMDFGTLVAATTYDDGQLPAGDEIVLDGPDTSVNLIDTFNIGDGGTDASSLLIQDGAIVTIGGDLNIGNVVGGVGIVDVENATLLVAGSLRMGDGGKGTLIVGTGAQVCFENGLILGPGADLIQYAQLDPAFLNGGANTISTSIEQDYNAYVTGAASFVINNGISYTLGTPKITGGAVTFQIGSAAGNGNPSSTLVLNAGTVAANTQISFKNNTGTLIIGTDTLGTIDIRATDSAAATLVANPNLYVPAIANFAGTIKPIATGGDKIFVYTTEAATFVDPNHNAFVTLWATASNTNLGTLAFVSAGSASIMLSNTLYLQDVVVSPLCFVAGTKIATPAGEAPIEQLVAGDEVTTLGGLARKIVWVGEGRVLATRGRRSDATPVIVRKGALADNVPNRDLRITKAHGLLIDGVLIPVEYLVNHRSILWDDRAQEVRVFHIELETHDVLVANGAPAESYRDDGNRWMFQNANSGWHLPPLEPYAEVLTGGPIVDAAWTKLLRRSGPRPALPLTADPDLHLLVDGRRVDRSWSVGEAFAFVLTRSPIDIRIVSRAASPQELGLARDPRCLGVALRNLLIRHGSCCRAIGAEDAMFEYGFHDYEADNGFRWTDGDAIVPTGLFAGVAGPVEVVLTVASTAKYIDDGAGQAVA